MSTRFRSADAFKQSLEDRIRREAEALGLKVQPFRQRCIFDRFLARLLSHFGDRAILKGGVALALLVPRARLTKDVDLTLHGRSENLLDEVQTAGRIDLGDFLVFEALPHADHPTIEGEGIVYEGLRFQIHTRLAGKRYGDPFGLDVAFGDRMLVPPELRTGNDFFQFAGLPPTKIRAYAREVHLAEKLHAYTQPRPRENSRVKDLPDMALLATTGPFDGDTLRRTIEATFTFRAVHPTPASLPAPPASWPAPYARLARENALPWPTLEAVFTHVSAFLDPILTGHDGTWDPIAWTWRAR
ncbi:nucleotidyl transferase AbiEii/AbiGii toxin family protein [Polyangium jinanense]|uniref:Nucleotidyl transferase AbiEii/AbiGii toxin family protein n=1 Tax=Polyangium jinanense TaxID=2829994 RepID=A0A9X3XED3_9BACT|nr:nucleotidyl transferase AbiEii/AbiGii toxin family protein [Polyangium jinanense]MDC3961173.1 nucleotidyl transferase AbiEii/AbiGii toxin family protein [Polyangium jinanense]MDC3986476.1 nucleotidyl transferase AbiEii/AbiGii toxin family protein [Polyangium jinanense]